MRKAVIKICLVTMSVIVVVTGTGYGAEAGINILSQTHHVWGDIGLAGFTSWDSYQSYDITDSCPISGSCSTFYSQDELVTESSGTGNFTVDTKSGTPFGMLIGGEMFGGGSAHAQIDYTFQPQTDSLQIIFSGNSGFRSLESGVAFVLKDLDTSVILDSRSWEWDHNYGDWVDDILPYSESYAVITNHTYSMTISAHSSISDIWSGYAHLEAIIVPEPVSFLLLGLGGLLFRK